ncbi:hypothetical protein N3K66_005287 [Trichothecium roseum]|uniref:Uncharacterized protein n=1 Tax=Trichothecium roseum TaxID=47278 RepID=A0ACC0UXY4_9HYPO|nr:hypothetical protein N3K66_005287 [Trichothecium roseum]
MFKAFGKPPGMRRHLPSLLGGVSSLPSSSRSITFDERKARHSLLTKIYEPFANYEKGSPEYNELARSGKVWEDYFRPSDDGPYIAIQKKYKDLLAQIDEFRKLMKPKIPDLAKTLVLEYAHQSVSIENNPLKLGESFPVFDLLTKNIFEPIRLTSLSAEDLVQLPLPYFDLGIDDSSVNELKNHIIVSQWIAENAKARSGTSGLDENEVRQLAARIIKGTESEAVYALSWGGPVPLGGYRTAPISVASNPLRIFPYPAEVPACMKRFFQWRDLQHEKKELHPLVHACHMAAYFVQIHPFPDGNGQMCRIVMHDYMVRQGYLPIVFQDLQRGDYLRMINDCDDHKPEEFILSVLTTQLDELSSFYNTNQQVSSL